MKVQVKAITPLGTFLSKVEEIDDEDLENIKEFLKDNDISYFKIKNEDSNEMIFKGELIKNSIFEFIITE